MLYSDSAFSLCGQFASSALCGPLQFAHDFMKAVQDSVSCGSAQMPHLIFFEMQKRRRWPCFWQPRHCFTSLMALALETLCDRFWKDSFASETRVSLILKDLKAMRARTELQFSEVPVFRILKATMCPAR